nr:uncharacterized protein LOC111419656 [Onthophagus taurus]
MHPSATDNSSYINCSYVLRVINSTMPSNREFILLVQEKEDGNMRLKKYDYLGELAVGTNPDVDDATNFAHYEQKYNKEAAAVPERVLELLNVFFNFCFIPHHRQPVMTRPNVSFF